MHFLLNRLSLWIIAFCLPFSIYSVNYQLINLDLIAFQESGVKSINNQGQIAGKLLHKNEVHVYIWDPVQKLKFTNVYTSTDPILNNNGEIFGSYWDRVSDGRWEYTAEILYHWKRPLNYFVWWNFKYPRLPFGEGQTAFGTMKRFVVTDANDKGYFTLVNDNEFHLNQIKTYRTWIYDGRYYNLIEHPQFHYAFKINNNLQALGWFLETEISLKTSKIIAHKTSIYDVKTKEVTVLDFPNGVSGRDLNDQGQVAGGFYNPATEKWEGFLREPSGELLIIENFYPEALNNLGQMVGFFRNGERKGYPAIWIDNDLIDIADVVVELKDDQGNEWDSLDQLVDINDNGQIVGVGTYKGKKHGFLLNPIP